MDWGPIIQNNFVVIIEDIPPVVKKESGHANFLIPSPIRAPISPTIDPTIIPKNFPKKLAPNTAGEVLLTTIKIDKITAITPHMSIELLCYRSVIFD